MGSRRRGGLVVRGGLAGGGGGRLGGLRRGRGRGGCRGRVGRGRRRARAAARARARAWRRLGLVRLARTDRRRASSCAGMSASRCLRLGAQLLQHVADLHHGEVLEDGPAQLLERGRLFLAALVDLDDVPAHVGLERLGDAAGGRVADHLGEFGRRLVGVHVAEVAAFHAGGVVGRLARGERRRSPRPSFSSAATLSIASLVGARMWRTWASSPSSQMRDLGLVHLLDGRLVDPLGDDRVDQDVAEDVLARRGEPVAGLRILVQPAGYRLPGPGA